MIKKGILKAFDSATYRATVQIAGSLSVWLENIPTSTAIAAADMVPGRSVAVLSLDPSNPADCIVVAVWGAVSVAGKYDYIDEASRLGFNPHIWAGNNGYKKSASNPIIDANDLLSIARSAYPSLTQTEINNDFGGNFPVVRYVRDEGRYYMLLAIDTGARAGGPGAYCERELYCISSTSPDFSGFTNHGRIVPVAPGTYYSKQIYNAGLIYNPFASGTGYNRKWLVPNIGWNGTAFGFGWFYSDSLTGGWQATPQIFSGVGPGCGAELIGRMLYVVIVTTTAAPWDFTCYQVDIGDYPTSAKYTNLGSKRPTLTGNYNNGFRFFTLFKHADGLYLVTYNENSAGMGTAEYGNIYLLVSGKFGQETFTVQSCSPILKWDPGIAWENNRIFSPWLLLEGNDVFLYYNGGQSANSPDYLIGLASQSGSV